MSDFVKQHMQELPDQEAELERAFGFMVEKLQLSKDGAVQGSTSYVQRKLQCGYNRAAALMEEMEKRFWVTAPNDVGARKIIRRS